MKIADIIGPDKSYEPPFRVMMPVNVFTDWGIEDSTGTPFGWGFYDSSIAQHVCDLLNKKHAETPREDSPRDEQIREVNPYKNYDTDPWMDDVRDWCRYQGLNEGARWADSHPCWHKYPEDKPRYSDTYIVAFDNEMVSEMKYFADLDRFAGYYISKIVAWMEQPNPPKFE